MTIKKEKKICCYVNDDRGVRGGKRKGGREE
jgi:hypothetical protein